MKLNKFSALVAVALAFGAVSAQAAGTASANLSISGTSVGTCTPQAATVDAGPINFNGVAHETPITLEIVCSDPGVAWSMSPDTLDADYRINSMPVGKVSLLTSGGSAAFSSPITGNGSSAAVGAKLNFTAPSGGPTLGTIGAYMALIVSY